MMVRLDELFWLFSDDLSDELLNCSVHRMRTLSQLVLDAFGSKLLEAQSLTSKL